MVGGEAYNDSRRAQVTIALVQSASKRDLTAHSGAQLLVADEVHRYGSEAWFAALRIDYELRLGLTGTLERGGDDG